MAAAAGNPARPEPAPRETCRSAWWSVGRFGLSVLLISVTLSLLARLVDALIPVPWSDLSWWRIVRRCVSVAAALSLWLCVRRFEGRSFRSYGLSAWRTGPAAAGARGGAGKRQLLLGVLVGLGTLGVMLGIGLASGACRVALTPDRARLWGTVLGFVPAAAVVSILEELVFRGMLLQHLLACSTPIAVIVSSALYAFVHLKAAAITFGTCRELGGLFLLGAVLSVSYLRTRQLYLAIGLHAVLAYGARVNKLLIEFADPALAWPWLVGTSRLVDGLMSWVALLGVGGLLVWWTRPPHAQAGSR